MRRKVLAATVGALVPLAVVEAAAQAPTGAQATLARADGTRGCGTTRRVVTRRGAGLGPVRTGRSP
jgi:hypothetical protein